MRALLLLSFTALACAPDFDDRPWLVETERVIAVVSEPAEARPGDRVSYQLFAAGPNGPVTPRSSTWSYCTTPRSLTENASVSEACSIESELPLDAARDRADGAIPSEACRLFGPDPPPGDTRPRDPDESGGYYQPVRVEAYGEAAVFLQRITCSPGDVAADTARDYSASYTANRNPDGVSLSVLHSTGTSVELEIEWRDSERENYAFIDREQQRVVTRREALSVDWFTSGGTLLRGRSSVAEGDSAVRVTNTLHAPSGADQVQIWAVIRDSRRGSAVLTRTIDLR